MALHEDTAAAAPKPPQPQQPRPQQQPQQDIFTINNRLSRPIPRANIGETTKKFHEAVQNDINNSFKESSDPAQKEAFRVLNMDTGEDQIAMSALLLCYAQSDGTNLHVAVHTLMLVATAHSAKMPSRYDNIQGRQVEIEYTPGDYFDKVMWDRIETKVKSVYGNKVKVVNAMCTVIPSEMSPDDSDHIHRVVYNACGAMYTMLDMQIGNSQAPFSASWVNRDGTKIATANLDYNPLPADDATGMPVRQDLTIAMRVTKGSSPTDMHGQTRELTQLGGFVDAIFSKPDVISNGFQTQIATQCLIPRFIITNADSEIDAMTPELLFLAISTSTLLWSSNSWMSAFLPRANGEPELRDVGAFGYEVNFTGDPNGARDRVDTRSDRFGTQELHQLLTATFKQGLVISIDIPERGEQSWLADMFVAAASQDQRGIEMIVTACDNLTDGNFSPIFNTMVDKTVLLDDRNRIHLGYWTNRKGERRDIRDFDYLAVLNRLGGKDHDAVVEWSKTFDAIDIPLETRLENRSHTLMGLSGETFRHLGWARRYTLGANFLEALTKAIAACNLTVRPNNINVDLIGAAGRPQFDASHAQYRGTGATGMFNTDSGYSRSYAGAPAPLFSGWLRR